MRRPLAKCERGHRFDPSEGSCPFCPDEPEHSCCMCGAPVQQDGEDEWPKYCSIACEEADTK